jgi:hypothetical protein
VWHIGVSALLKALRLVGGLGFKTHGPSNILISCYDLVQFIVNWALLWVGIIVSCANRVA